MGAPIIHTVQTFVQENHSSEDFSEKLKSCTDYNLFYHLSDFRRAIIQWYPFKRDSRILEVNAELGAVTGALCDCAAEVVSLADSDEAKEIISLRYKNRKNLTCILNDQLDAHEKKSFDYIVYIGGLEYFYTESGKTDAVIRRISDLGTYLKPGGTFLLAAENRYGIDNWLGKKDSFTGIPFDAINNYMSGSEARSFTKVELEGIIKAAGYKKHKFYYPVPDYRSARTIYTDDVFPEDNDIERMETAYSDTSSFIAGSVQLYDDIARAHCFPFFSNSYFVEMTDGATTASARCITTSYKRGREKAFSVIMEAGSVYKKCCFPEGLPYAGHLCMEASELRNRKIPVIDMTMLDDGFVMPLVKAPTLQKHIRDLAERQDRSRILVLLDRLWDYILNSSDYTDECAFDIGTLDAGPILRKAFIELIPLNCFYTDGDLLFFDQEFSKENYPARYVMARCIKNLYVFIQTLAPLIPPEECYARYGMDAAQWKLFMTVDSVFLREADPYPFYNAWINPGQVRMNQLLLSGHIRQLPLDSLMEYGSLHGKNILVYGTGARARDLISILQRKGIAGILDRVRDSGEVLGVPVLRWEDIQPGTADAIIIAARPQFHREIYERIAGQCIRLGLAVFLFG